MKLFIHWDRQLTAALFIFYCVDNWHPELSMNQSNDWIKLKLYTYSRFHKIATIWKSLHSAGNQYRSSTTLGHDPLLSEPHYTRTSNS